MAEPALSKDIAAYCAALVRERDPDRYFADLFAPEPARRHLFALHAFNSEVVRVRDLVSEPLPGEMRLQWWRDAFGAGEAGGHPVATAILETIATFRLPLSAFERLLDARIFDLYNDPMPDLAAFEAYAGETTSSLFQLAAIIIAGGTDPGSADAAGHAGVAYALTGVFRALPAQARRQQLLLPADVLARHDVAADDIFSGAATDAVRAAFVDFRQIARDHLALSRAAMTQLPAAIRAAFLPLALIEPYLDRMERLAHNPFRTAVDLPLWRRQWILWRAARRGLP